MIDQQLLDSMNFGELNQALDYVIEKIGQINAELAEGEDDPRTDMLMVVAKKIIMQMDAIIRQHGINNPALLAQWNRQMKDYKAHFEKYEDILLAEGTPLDSE